MQVLEVEYLYYPYANVHDNIAISNVTITKNTASNGGRLTIAPEVDRNNISIINCTFINNKVIDI